MNFKSNALLRALVLILFFSITTNAQSQTNALGQQIKVIGHKKNIDDSKNIYKYLLEHLEKTLKNSPNQ